MAKKKRGSKSTKRTTSKKVAKKSSPKKKATKKPVKRATPKRKTKPARKAKSVSREIMLEGNEILVASLAPTGRCEMTYMGNTSCEDGISRAECMRKPEQYLGATVRFYPNETCPD